MTTVVDHSAFLADVDAHILELLAPAPVAGSDVLDAARTSVQAGGKRLRPLLVVAARPVGADETVFRAGALRSAAAVELVHTASLVHDDLLDDAPLRRGLPTVAASHGAGTAVAVGDLLFSRAFGTLVDSEPGAGPHRAQRAVQILADVARRLAEGEALQADQLRDTQLSHDSYVARCAGKTGVLFRAALQLGGVFGDASDVEIARLGEFGETVGVAFQLADDVLDCGDDAELLGKVPGADVRDGTITLPMLIAMQRDPDLVAILAAPIATEGVEEVLGRIRATGAVEAAREHALELRDGAVELLEPLTGRFDTALLRSVADRAVDRLA